MITQNDFIVEIPDIEKYPDIEYWWSLCCDGPVEALFEGD